MTLIDPHTLRLLEFDRVLPELERRADSVWGRELARAACPYTEIDEAQTEQQRVREWHLLELGEPAPSGLGVPDLRELLRAVRAGSILDAGELRAVLDVVLASAGVRRVLDARADEAPLLIEESTDLIQFRDLEHLITATVDESGAVRDDASPELRRLRQSIEATRARLERRLEQIAANVGPASFVTRRGDRFTVAVAVELLGRVKGVVHDRSASGASVFLEPLETVEAQNRLREAEGAEQAEILKILRRCAAVVRARHAEILAAAAQLARLDAVRAKERLWREIGGVLPDLHPGGPIRIRGGRHPLLERALRDRGQTLVPIQLELDSDRRVLVVTGPNMGGKTVALKTLGILTVMGMAGMPVPAAEGTVLGFFASIVADIGDEQSIEQNLSTFASHLRQISAAVEQAAPSTLVLLDELGAGTDPAEGGALGQAVLEHLAGSGALVMVTTHHGELKGMAVRHPTIVNASMAFDTSTHQPLYELVMGVPGRSLALDVAAGLGLRPAILDRARQLVSGDEARLQELIIDLERQRSAAAALRGEAAEERQRLGGLRQRYQDRLDRIRELKERIAAQARREADGVLNEARDALRVARRAVRQGGAGRISPARAPAAQSPMGDAAPPSSPSPPSTGDPTSLPLSNADLDQLARQLEGIDQRIEALGPRPQPVTEVVASAVVPGRVFWVPELGSEVEVLSVPDRAGRVRVQRGALRLELRLGQLQPPDVARRSEKNRVSGSATTAGRTPDAGTAPSSAGVAAAGYHLESSEPPPLELDLRGMTGDEAVESVQRYLDRAALHNLPRVRIIHGKGTGVLRDRVHRLLAAHPQVARQRLGEIWEGGTGVTVAEIR